MTTSVAPRRGAGPRSRRRARERQRRRLRRRLSVLATTLLVGGAVAGVTLLVTTPAQPPAPSNGAESDVGAPAPEQATLLLVREPSEGGAALGATLLAVGGEDVPAAALFIPVGTLLDVPGIGLERVDRAHHYGGAPLVSSAVGNALGVDIDHVATVSESGLAAWLGSTGGLTVDVPERLVQRDADGIPAVRFELGEQFLDGRRLAEYWGFRARGEDELAAFPRQQLVWAQLLERARDDPGLLDQLAGPQLDTTATRDWARGLLANLVQAYDQGRLTFTLLPVEPFGGSGQDGTASYRPQEPGVSELVGRLLGPSIPVGGGSGAVRVQVLNGVGVPGVGQEVDQRLRGSGLRIVLTDNARSFDFDETQILIYEETPQMLSAAHRVQEHLGVGRIAVSRQPQTVVDLTIVVGADFLQSRPRAGSRPTEQ